ncbi:MAG TPA: polysaccharide deacetylase family protein [Bacteroidota bacterium]
MKASIKVKSVLASFLHLAGVNSWKLGRYSRDDIAVLVYHRVIPMKEMGPAVQAGMVVEPNTLDLHLRYLRNHFEIIPLSYLVSGQHNDAQDLRKKPLCVLTFDDGWCDFYEYAYPILKVHEAPATVFLPTDFIGTDRWFWTDRVGCLLDRIAQSWNLAKCAWPFSDPLLRELASISGTHETRLERAIALLKPYRIEKIEEVLSELSATLGEDSTPAGRAFLSWEEVREMSRSGLVCFGSHTAGHPLLTTLTEEQVQHELRQSMDVLIGHKVTNTNFISFSYPNGSFSDRLSEMVREAGYHLAVTTQNGWHRQGANPFTIKRIAIHQDMASTEAMFGSRIVNLL